MQTVAVVGAGVAGLQACRALLKRGFSVAVFEEQANVGGVWSKNYSGYGIEVPQSLYEFPEFGWERLGASRSAGAANSAWTPGEAVLGYVQAYVKHFELEQHIRFRCTVARIIQHKAGNWVVTYLDGTRGTYDTYTADYVVISTGLYSSPRIPQFQGHEAFQGLQLHAREFTDRSLVVGKRVVIIGAGKTAMDCAASAAQAGAAAVTWLFRRVHWPIPPKLLRGIPMESFLFSKLPTLLCPPYYTATSSKQGMASLMRPMQLAVWRALEKNIKDQLGLVGPLGPAEPLQVNLLHSGQIVDAAWITMINRQALMDQTKRKGSARSSRGKAQGSGGFLSGLMGGWWRKGRRQQQQEQEQDKSVRGGGNHRAVRGSPETKRVDSITGSRGVARPAVEGSQRGRRSGDKQPPPPPPAATAGADGGKAAAALGSSKCNTPDEADVPLPNAGADLASQLQQVSEVLKLLPKGTQIVPIQGKVAQFTAQGIRLANGMYLPADVVMYCTGYMKTYDYLTGGIKARLGLQKDGLHLYRSVLPPQLPRLGFVGSEVSTLNNVLTSGLQAEWLAEHWAGACQLPPAEIMQSDIRQQQEWRRRLMPESRNRGAVYQLYMYKYHKQLVTDMGLAPPRRSLTKVLEPLTAKHYAHVFKPSSNSSGGGCTVPRSGGSSTVSVKASGGSAVELHRFKSQSAMGAAYLDTAAATGGMLRPGVGAGAGPAAAVRAMGKSMNKRQPPGFQQPGSSSKDADPAPLSTTSRSNSVTEPGAAWEMPTVTNAGEMSTGAMARRAGTPPTGTPPNATSPVGSPRATRRSVGGIAWEAPSSSERYACSPSNLQRSVGGGSITAGHDMQAALEQIPASPRASQRRSMPGLLLVPAGDTASGAGDAATSPAPLRETRRSVSGLVPGASTTTRAAALPTAPAAVRQGSPRADEARSPMGVHLTLKQELKQQHLQQQRPQSPRVQSPAFKADVLQAHLSSPREDDGGDPSCRSSYTAAWVTLQAAGVPSGKPQAAAASTTAGEEPTQLG